MRQVNHFVLGRQHLLPDAHTKYIIGITDDVCGLHATSASSPYLSLYARTDNFKREKLENELFREKTLGKIRCMRGTLYIQSREMMPVVFSATKSIVEKISVRFAEYYGFTGSTYAALSLKVSDMVKGRELTAAQIKAGLNRPELHLPALLNLMCDRGLLVRLQRNWKANNYRYGLFRDYFPGVNLQKYSEFEAISLLLVRYLYSFGPAAENDIAWWTGLSKAMVKRTLTQLGKKITSVKIKKLDGDFLILSQDLDLIRQTEMPDKPAVNLLPALDPLLMGYKNRERYLDYDCYYNVYDGSGNAVSSIMVDGKITGVWDYAKPDSGIKIFLFDKLRANIVQELEEKAGAAGKFLSGKKVNVEFVNSMVPLNKRNAGAVFTPLKESRELFPFTLGGF